MASLKDLRGRIGAIQSTEKITSAMKMVAAAKFKHVEDLIAKGTEYRNNLYDAVGRLLSVYKREYEETGKVVALPKLMHTKSLEENQKYLLIVLSSDRGLCGSYNLMVARKAQNRIEELKAGGKEIKVVCFGTKAYSILKKHYEDIIVSHDVSVANKGVDYEEAEAVGDMILELFAGGETDVCEMVYSHFISALNLDMVSRQVFPLKFGHLVPETVNDTYYEAEPGNEQLLDYLLPLVFKEMIFEMMTNSEASEQGARMSSMDNATRNANDMVSKLKLTYNRMRQSAITTELTEIIAGAEAAV